MAEALTRRRSRQGRKPEAHRRELKRLVLSICDDTGFRLYLATYDHPKRRDELIARAIAEAEPEKVMVTRLDLTKAESETNLVELLRAHVQETEPPTGWRRAVMVTGIEQRLDYSGGRRGLVFLHQANLLRDALPKATPVPVVLWLSRTASALLPAEAPDLWHWRAGNFDFTGDEAPRVEVLRELATLRPEQRSGLTGEQQRARVRVLEELLEELGRESAPKTKRQAAERASLLMEIGRVQLDLGRPADAIPNFEQALEIFRKFGDRASGGYALGNLGNAWLDLSEPRRAIEFFEPSLTMARELGDRGAEGRALGNLGNAWAYFGDTRRAIEHHEQALKIARETGDRRDEGYALGNLGNAWLNLGEPRQALEFYEPCLAIARELGDRRDEGATLTNLGNAWADLGEPQRAVELYEQALIIAHEFGDRRGEGNALGNLGNAWSDLGEPRRAIEHQEQHLAIARKIGDRIGEGNALFNSGLAFDALGERNDAVRRVREALSIYEAIEATHLVEQVRAQLAQWGAADERS